MISPLLSLFLFLALLLILIGATELLHRYAKMPTEQSRKFLHVVGGLVCLLLPSFFPSHWWLLPLAVIAFGLLLLTYLYKKLPSIHQTKRQSVGSVLFPFPVYFCFLLADLKENDLFFYLPVSLLTISDTAAEIGGTRWGHLGKQFFRGQKTLAGSLSFFITAIPVCLAWLLIFHYPLDKALLICLLIAITATIAEAVTLHGWDNLSIPAVAVVILLLFL